LEFIQAATRQGRRAAERFFKRSAAITEQLGRKLAAAARKQAAAFFRRI
jgi:hypothetical protein